MSSETPIYTDAQRDAVEATPRLRELSYRKSYGIEVTLWWVRRSNTLQISYVDEQANEAWESVVPNDQGLNAFYHPVLYKPEAPSE